MKKIVLSLVTVLAAIAFAPEASALPLFARQTGMACNACHYQHFPLLSAFGRAFKASAFTLMGAQGRIEGEGLSIPDTVNLGVFTTTFFQTQSAGQTSGVDNAVDAGVPKWGVPGTGGELSLFLGGRISEFAGFLAEAGLGGGGPSDLVTNGTQSAGGGVVGPAKLAMLFPVGDARVGTVIFTSPDQGVAYSFELLNTGAAATHKMMGNGGPSDQHVRAAYAAQYLGTNTAATGIALVATNGIGFVNIAAYEMAGNDAVGGANNMNLTYIRVAGITDIAGWDTGFGIQNFGGTSTVTNMEPRATIIDAQMQGDLAGMPAGFYASYGTAAAGANNPFNSSGADTKTSLNVSAELGVVPHTTVQVAVRLAKNGAASDNTDNALMLGVTYDLAQNISLSYNHTQQSGSAWTGASFAGNELPGKTANTLLMEVAF